MILVDEEEFLLTRELCQFPVCYSPMVSHGALVGFHHRIPVHNQLRSQMQLPTVLWSWYWGTTGSPRIVDIFPFANCTQCAQHVHFMPWYWSSNDGFNHTQNTLHWYHKFVLYSSIPRITKHTTFSGGDFYPDDLITEHTPFAMSTSRDIGYTV